MKQYRLERSLSMWLVLLVVLLAACTQNQPSTPEQPSEAPLYGMDNPDRIPGSYIVVMKDGSQEQAGLSAASLSALTTLEGLSIQARYDMRGFQGFSAKMSDEALEQVRKNPNVAFVEADSVIKIDLPKGEVESITPLAPAVSWGQDRIDQHDLPLNNTINPSKTGRGVNVYVLDSGIRRTHQEFGNRVAAGVSFIFDGLGTDDCTGHGTHVAGTIGGRTVGVAPEVTLIPVRVLNCDGLSTTTSLIDGVRWITNNVQHPAVVNASIGSRIPFPSIDAAVASSIANDITYVVAAGNAEADACNSTPGRVREAITVGATINTDAKWVGSNWGGCVDVFAPGVDIRSAYPPLDTTYFHDSGTSMAAPHVTGAVAAMLTVDPLYSTPILKPYQLERRIKACSTKFIVTSAQSTNNHLAHLCHDYQYEFGDVNGDKRQDLIRFGEQGTDVALAFSSSTGTSFRAFKRWIDNFGYVSGWRETRHVRRVGDVNGDGKADIVGFGETGVYVATSTGTSFSFKGQWIANYGHSASAGQWDIKKHDRRVADVNGDGKADIIGFASTSVFVSLSTGSSFSNLTQWSTDFNSTTGWNKTRHVRHVADVNGDGKADIVGFGEQGVHVGLSTGSNFVYSGMWIANYAQSAHGWSVYKHERLMGDINADGKADIVGFGEFGVWLSYSTGTSFQTAILAQPEFDYESGWHIADSDSPFSLNTLFGDYAVAHPRFVADFTGNGRADIIGFGNTNKPFRELAVATGTPFGFSDKFMIRLPRE